MTDRASKTVGPQGEKPEPAILRGPGGFPQPLLPEPPGRRLRQYMMLGLLTAAVVACALWMIWAQHTTRQQAQANAEAAEQLCRQVSQLGQPCAVAPSDNQAVATAQAVAPIASASLTAVAPASGAPAPTDENGVPQAFAPGPGAMIVAIGVNAGELILTYDDGARVDAGPVDLAKLAIVLRTVASVAPSPVPPVSPTPSPSPSPVTDSSAPEQSPTPSGEVSTEETP